nr:ribosomal protein S11 [Ipomoea trifida]
MAKAIPRRSSRRNGRIGSRKSARRIPKGVIHVQASFNNTIVTVTDVRGRVVSWSSAGTSGFKGTRRGTPFAAETAASNAIRTVVDRGMLRAEVMIKGPGLGRDAALRAILQSGQADTIGIAMRRALLGEIEGTCITRVKSEKAPHEYSTIAGNVAPMPNQRATAVPIKKTVVATGRRNGFWNLLTFSKKGTVNNPAGNISNGVANGSAGSPIIDGSRTAKPTLHAIVPRITTGKIYKRSLGHAGSP